MSGSSKISNATFQTKYKALRDAAEAAAITAAKNAARAAALACSSCSSCTSRGSTPVNLAAAVAEANADTLIERGFSMESCNSCW